MCEIYLSRDIFLYSTNTQASELILTQSYQMFTYINGFKKFWGDWTTLFDRSDPSGISLVLLIIFILCVLSLCQCIVVIVIAMHPN